MFDVQYLRWHITNKWLSNSAVNHLNAQLNPICHLLALLQPHHILHVSRMRVNTVNTVRNWLGYLVLGSLTFLIPWFSEVYMSAELVLGVKLGRRNTCHGIIIIPSYIATYHLIQKLLNEKSYRHYVIILQVCLF